MKIDLQIHSVYSDGFYAPTELVVLAKEHGLSLMSITDHDTTAGVEEALRAGEEEGVKVVSGVEITTLWQGKILHLLGYNFDLENKKLRTLLSRLWENRETRAWQKIEILNKRRAEEGVPLIDTAGLKNYCDGNFCSRTMFSYLVERGIAENMKKAGEYFATAKVDYAAIDIGEAIQAIHTADGIAVLSHPFAPKIALKNITDDFFEQKQIIKELKEKGLDGLEAFQACHDEKDTEKAIESAREFDLLVTAGSDWHGPLSRVGRGVLSYIPYYVDMIGDVAAPDEVVNNLLEKFRL